MKTMLQIEKINGYVITDIPKEQLIEMRNNDTLKDFVYEVASKTEYPLDYVEIVDVHYEEGNWWIEFNGNLDLEILIEENGVARS